MKTATVNLEVGPKMASSHTYREKPPHNRGGGEAGEDVVGAGKVCEVRKDDGLSPALAPHVHLATLGLSS